MNSQQQQQQQPKINKTANNKFYGCPALMEDGRVFTDYRPSTFVNDNIRFSNNIQSNYDYRQFLIHNGNNIMTVNNGYTKKKLGCEGVSPVDIPEQSICTVNTEGILACKNVNSNGFGSRNVVPPNTAPQLGMEQNIHGAVCSSNFGNASPLTPQWDFNRYARF